MFIQTRVLSVSKYPCLKKIYSMKTIINLEEFYRLGGRNMFTIFTVIDTPHAHSLATVACKSRKVVNFLAVVVKPVLTLLRFS